MRCPDKRSSGVRDYEGIAGSLPLKGYRQDEDHSDEVLSG